MSGPNFCSRCGCDPHTYLERGCSATPCPMKSDTSRSETGTLDMSEKARLKDAEDDVLRLHGEKMKFFERTIVLERELAAMTRDRDARAREACTAEGRTGCSFALSATAKSLTTETADSVERYRLALQLLWELHGQKEVHLGMERHSGVAQHCASCICWAALNGEVDVETLKVELEILRAPHKDRHHE